MVERRGKESGFGSGLERMYFDHWKTFDSRLLTVRKRHLLRSFDLVVKELEWFEDVWDSPFWVQV